MHSFTQLYRSAFIAFYLFVGSTVFAAEKPAKSAVPVAFDTHTGYFVSNKFEPKASASFIVFQDQKAFDHVFGTAMVIRDKSHRLAPGAFEKKIVLAVIHRGKAVVRYNVESVTVEDKTISLQYSTKTGLPDTAEFACPLIISIGKDAYKAVRFIEDGKEVKKLKLRSIAGSKNR
jgi:hypothetical protein